MSISIRHSRAALLALAIAACRSAAPDSDAGGGPTPAGGQGKKSSSWPQQLVMEFARAPEPAPAKWMGIIGEYGPDTTLRWYALERDRRMYILDQYGNYVPLAEKNDSIFDAPRSTAFVSGEVHFLRDTAGRATAVRLGDMMLARRKNEPPPGATQLRITPLRPVDELRREALVASPPAETGSFKVSDLVDLVSLDTTIKLEIRYATDNNFLGTKVYEQPRAFMQRPAAEALVRANKALKPTGYGLLIHDAYRPWYVTKIFWDATPDSLRWLVANPAEGSRHNRGAAVDLTLYKLETGKPVEMPSTYDESTDRAFANYPGGTALQRWYRALLKRAVEHEGFIVNPKEWWHFDFKDWKSYPIGNIPFDQVRPAPTPNKP